VSVTQAATFTITATPGTETIKHDVLAGFILTLKSLNGIHHTNTTGADL
jgi:hypothetical protein